MKMTDLREFLLAHLEQKQSSTPDYSLSAFARYLGLSRQKLNSILHHGAGISTTTAIEVARKLKLSKEDREMFIAMVEAQHHRAKTSRKAAQKKVENLNIIKNNLDPLKEQDYTSLVEKWQFGAISVLVDLEDFRPDYQWIAQKLGMSFQEAKEACERLFALGFLVEENGRWMRDSSKYRITADSPSKNLRGYHRDILQKAEESLETVALEKRHSGTMIVSVTQDDIGFVKDELKVFQHTLLNKVWMRGGKSERVYALSLNFFPLDKE